MKQTKAALKELTNIGDFLGGLKRAKGSEPEIIYISETPWGLMLAKSFSARSGEQSNAKSLPPHNRWQALRHDQYNMHE